MHGKSFYELRLRIQDIGISHRVRRAVDFSRDGPHRPRFLAKPMTRPSLARSRPAGRQLAVTPDQLTDTLSHSFGFRADLARRQVAVSHNQL